MMRRTVRLACALGMQAGGYSPVAGAATPPPKFSPRPSVCQNLTLVRKPIEEPEDVVNVVLDTHLRAEKNALENAGGSGLTTTMTVGTDGISLVFFLTGWSLFIASYIIIFNWLYEGYCDFWDGTYGLDDDDDDDD